MPQAGIAGIVCLSDEKPFDRETLDAVLDWCFVHEPPFFVMALDESGLAVPMPPTVPVAADRVVSGVGSAVEVCSPDDLNILVDAWERVRQTGGSQAHVHLRIVPEHKVMFHFIDARYRYGVFLVFFAGNLGEFESSNTGPSLFRPRLCSLERNEISVICAADEAVTKILGWSQAELIGMRTLDLIHPDDRPLAVANWMEMLARPDFQQRALFRYRHREGRYVWLESLHQNRLNDPSSKRIITHMIDVSDRMEAMDALHENERLLRRLTEALPIGIIQIDAQRRIVHVNERLGTMVGVTGAATIEEQFALAVGADRDILSDVIGTVLNYGLAIDIEVRLELPEGRRRCSIGLQALTNDDGTVTGALACVADITESVRMREELKRRATFDDLTRCYNRPTIIEELDALLRSPDVARSGIAVLFVDLDNFKAINDCYGHAAGDDVLRVVGKRLLEEAGPGDLVGRLGGDEFLVVCRDVASPQTALEMARRFTASIAQPATAGAQTVVPRASIGVVWTASLSASADALVARADAAMYEAKRRSAGPILCRLDVSA